MSNKFRYQRPWPGYDWASFINADQVSEGIDVSYFRKIKISEDATVLETKKAAREIIAETEPEFSMDIQGEWPVSYSLYYPNHSSNRLLESAKLSELGATNDEIMYVGTAKEGQANNLLYLSFEAMVTVYGRLSVSTFDADFYFIIATNRPLRRMTYYPSPDHIHVNLYHTLTLDPKIPAASTQNV